MKRTKIVLTSGGSIIVRGDIDYIGGRVIGHRGGMIFLTLSTRIRHTDEYEEKSVIVNIEQITCMMEVSE